MHSQQSSINPVAILHLKIKSLCVLQSSKIITEQSRLTNDIIIDTQIIQKHHRQYQGGVITNR